MILTEKIYMNIEQINMNTLQVKKYFLLIKDK